jgi:hypothetical protein
VRLLEFLYIATLTVFAISCSKDKGNNTFEKPISITTNAIDTVTSVDSLWVKTDPTVWTYDTSGPSTEKITLRGNTNADSVGIEAYGDGITSIRKLNLDSNHIFHDTICISFMPRPGQYMISDTKMILYKANGDSTEIALLSPKH